MSETSHDSSPAGEELSRTDKIAIGIGVSFGVAAVVVGLVTIWMGWMSLLYTKIGVIFQRALLSHTTDGIMYGIDLDQPPPYRERL